MSDTLIPNKGKSKTTHEGEPMQFYNELAYLQGRNDFIPNFFDRNHVATHLRIYDALLFFPAYHDGFLTMCRAAHFLLFTLRGQSGVGVGDDHGRN